METVERDIQAAGVSTFARITGEGDGTLVLLHGAEADGSMWEPYMADLAEGRRVYAVDLPGSGRSKAPKDLDSSPMGLARWLAALLDVEGIDRCDLLGHSLGGSIAVHCALHVPDRIRRLVLVSAASLVEPEKNFAEGAEELLTALVDGSLDGARAAELLSSMYARRPDDPVVLRGADYWALPGVRRFFRNGALEIVRPISPLILRQLKVPTLMIWGARDRFFPAKRAREAAQFVPESRIVVMEGAGHSPFEEARGTFMLVVGAFLEG
jgi:pimeloyl-ACP methyl ester carboxylesterase